MTDYDLICCVVNNGQGSRLLKVAKHNGIKGGTIFMGVGTVKSKLLEFLDLDDVRREIVLMAAESETATAATEALSREMGFKKPNHGIAFTFPINNLIGTLNHIYSGENDYRVVNGTMYNAIFTVVDRGMADDVIAAGKEAGARGGTVIHARGSGIHETEVLFAMPIEPEKDIVLILAQSGVTGAIVESIRTRLKIEKPGSGIIFTLGVKEAYGLY